MTPRKVWLPNTAYAVGDIVVPTVLNGYEYKCRVAGTSSMPPVGSPVTNRGSGISSPFGTVIDLANPMVTNETLLSVTARCSSNIASFKIGIFYLVSGTTYKCRSATVDLGSMVTDEVKTFVTSLVAHIGDFIGCKVGAGGGGIDYDSSGGTGAVQVSGDHVIVDDSASYTAKAGWAISIHGNMITYPVWPTTLGATLTDNAVTWVCQENNIIHPDNGHRSIVPNNPTASRVLIPNRYAQETI
jgi:hypothetical protein